MKKKKTTGFDLNKPVNLDNFTLKEDDCFGLEWTIHDPICLACHSYEICSMVLHNENRKKIKKLTEEKGPFLDTVNFDKVPWSKLLKNIKASPLKFNMEQLIDSIQKNANCKDRKTCYYQAINFINENQLENVKGQLR